MAEKERSIWNWFWNTVRIPQRVVGTAWLLGADVIKTTTWVVEDFWSVVDNTTNKIVGLFSKDKKWYQKILNVPVAAWVGIVWAVEAAVKPVVNWVSNVWKTALNTVTNAWKSTFWSLFSAKPVSDISFNTLKTKKGIVHLDTQKRTLDPNKPWTINRWNWSKDKKKTVAKTAVAAWAATAAATTAAATTAWSKEIRELKTKMQEMESTMNTMKEKYEKELKKALDDKNELETKYKSLTKTNESKDWEIAKLKEEIAWLKKNSEKPVEIKPEKKEERPADAKSEKKEEKPKEDKSEKKEGEWKAEKKEEKASEKSEIKDSERILELIESDHWKKMINYLKNAHPEIKMEMDSSTENWKLCWSKSWNKIIIGTKKKENAPQILLHEISHIMEQDNVKWVKELKDSIKKLNERYGKQLFHVSNNDKYDTKDKKTIEDICEIIAMYARDDWSFQKHMEKLQNGENEKLAKIDKSDTENLKSLCEKIISNLD